MTTKVYVGPAEDPIIMEDDCPNPGISWNGLTLPEWEDRQVFAPPSNWVPGNVLLSTVRDTGTVPVSVIVRGTTLDDMMTRQAALESALEAWPGLFKVVVEVDGGPVDGVTIAGPWDSFPTVPRWGDLIPDLLTNFFTVQGAFALSVNPAGSP